MSALAPAIPLPDQPDSDKTEYDHGSLRIREKTLVIGNSIYPIASISRVTVADLRTPVPRIVWIMLVAGVLAVLMRRLSEDLAAIGALLVLAACYMLYLNWKSRSGVDYALSVQMNSGNTAVITSDDGDFLKAIAVELYEVIELEKASNTTFNIDQKVMIDSITGSTVRIAGMEGDIVNNVPGT